MPVSLSGADEVSVSFLVIGSAVLLLLCGLIYLSALCFYTVDHAAVSNLKALPDTAAVQKAIAIKNNGAAYSRRLKSCVLFHTVTAVWLTVLLYWQPLGKLCQAALSDPTWSLIVSGVLLGLLLLTILLTLVEFLPMKAAATTPEKYLLRWRGLITFWGIVFLPLTLLGTGLSDALAHLFLREDKQVPPPENPTEEKILMMVDEGEVNGTIEVNTKSMIENVFDFDDTTVGEIMTHRKDIVAVQEDDTLTKLRQLAVESGCSRIPVYHEDIDDIIGVIYVKDLLPYIGCDNLPDTPAKKLLRPAVYVPVSKSCSEMFRYMTAHKTQIAVVVDEFGGTAGLITMEDLIESILGNIQDEYDHEDDSIRKVDEYSFQVDGATPLDEIEALTGISFPEDENDTIAGVMLDRMGHIPKTGEHPSIMINGTRFTVLEVDQRRISRVLIVKHHQPTPPTPQTQGV